MSPFLFVIALIAAGVWIVAFTHIALLLRSRTKWNRNRRVDQSHDEIAGHAQEGHGSQDKDGGPSANFTALINTINAQGRANRAEEKREDDAKQFREYVTIILIACTLLALSWQVYEMIEVYTPIETQAVAAKEAASAALAQSKSFEEATIQAQRAWVGPRNATLSQEPKVGEPFDIVVSYDNSGREPALGFIDLVAPIPQIGDNDPDALERIESTMKDCQNWKIWKGGAVVYPNTAAFSNGYTVTAPVDKTFVTAEMTTGQSLIVVHGCFVYRTFNRPKYVYFCYFYKHGVSKITGLNICPTGHDAN
jgi:hypothetical protein